MPRFDLKSIISSLDDEGFRYFKSDRVFCKRVVRNGVPLYLTMGINKHRFYDSLYTMDLYVNVHTKFLEVGGVPFNYNRLRPGRLLSEHERENLCATEKSTTDVWWDLSDARELDDFVASVKLASRRILDDSSFIDRFINDAHNNEAINENYTVDFAYTNAGRASHYNTSMTYSDLYNIFPFDNTVHIIEVTGREAANMLRFKNNIYRADPNMAIRYEGVYKVACLDYLAFHCNDQRDYDFFPNVKKLGKLTKNNNDYIYREILKDYFLEDTLKKFNAEDYSFSNPEFAREK